MASPTEEFVSNFRSLSGTTIGERRKHFFHLLNKFETSKENIIFSAIRPQTPFEETLKIEGLIRFRKVTELLEVLRSENPVVIKKVLRNCPWMWENVSEDELVTLIFPHVSFNVKVKILNKLSICLDDVEKADGIFEAIRRKYGSYLAWKLLPACSKEVIMHTMMNSKVYLTSSQLLLIVKKYPELSKSILDAMSNRMGVNKITMPYKIIVYLASSHNDLFLDVCDKYNFPKRLGWRITRKFISTNKALVIREANAFHKILHARQSFKSMGLDFEEFYFHLFPPSIEQFTQSFNKLYYVLKHFRTDEEKLHLLEGTFKRMYVSDILEHPQCINVTLLNLLPLSRRAVITQKPPHISENQWQCYMGVDHSIPYLKKQICLTSDVQGRTELIVNLIETCRINKDFSALAEVCKYVVNQHRNDHYQVRSAFVSAIRHSFLLEKLEQEHWTYINELLDIFSMNRESISYAMNFLVAFIRYRLLRNEDVREQLSKYIVSVHGRWNLFTDSPILEKQCLLLAAELAPEAHKERELKYSYLTLLNSLIDWNIRHPEDEIALLNFPDAMNSFRQMLMSKNCNDSIESIIIYLLKLNIDDLDLLRLCLSKLRFYFSNRNVVNRLIRSKPLFVLDNVDIISKLALKWSNRFFWRQSRNYTHLDIPQKYGAVCLDVLTRRDQFDISDLMKRNAAVGLSYLMNPNDFIQFASNYYPEKLKVDILSEESKIEYKLQKAIAASLKNVIPSSLALPSILNFSKGDYLKLIQSSLYSASGNVTEDKLPSFFAELGKRAVSVRKHAFHLTLRVLERSVVFDVFRKFMLSEKNPSIRKFLFKGSFNLFIQDPDVNLWELVKSNLSTVDVGDREIVQHLVQLDVIPPSFMVRYIMFIWQFLEKLPDPQGVNKIEQFRILRWLTTDTIQMLPPNFCADIVEKYLFKHTICNIDSFACKFFIYCISETDRSGYLNKILPIFKDYLKKDNHRSVVERFLKQFCSEFLNSKCLDREILYNFYTTWSNYIKPFEAFDHYLYMQLCLIYIDSVNGHWSHVEVGENLGKLVDSLSNVYSLSIVSVASDVLVSFLTRFLEKNSVERESSRYLIIEGMLKGNCSQACRVTAVYLLKRNVEYSTVKHNEIVESLNKLEDPIIQIHLNHHLYRM